MSKDKYYNRLEELFSNIEPVEPVPQAGDGGSSPAEFRPMDSAASQNSASAEISVAARMDEAPADAVHLKKDTSSKEKEAQPGAELPLSFASSKANWEDFLDGIHRSEHIGYVYDAGGLKEVESLRPSGQGNTLDASIEVAGEEIGKLLLERDSNRGWTEDDVSLINTVVQQLTQQMETLRLLDEAQRSRSEAEQAFRRLARQGGRNVSEETEIFSDLRNFHGWSKDGQPLGFRFEASEVQPVDRSIAPVASDQAIQAGIYLSGGLAGKLQVESERPVSGEEADLVETIAQRLAQQVENLRLLEESRHYRSEAEDAIRRLTYQSWQTYLKSAAAARLGFQYDLNRVSTMDTVQLAAQNPAEAFQLRVRDEVIGEITIEEPEVESQEAAELMEVIADRLSTHLEGLRLAEQREQALAESETLYTISAKLSTAQSMEEALSSVSEPARESGARDSRLFFVSLDERGVPEGLNLAAVWYPEEGAQLIPVNTHFLLRDYPTYWQILQDPGHPTLIDDVMADPRLDQEGRDLLVKTGARAVAVLPLAISGRWVGVVLIHWEHPHHFSEQEVRLYASLARQAAVVVNNRLLLEQTRKRAQELQTVAQVSTAASTILDPRELLQSVVDLTKSSFSLYHVQAYLLTEGGQILEVAAGAGDVGRQMADEKQYVLLDGSSLVARVARERQVTIVNDVQGEPGFAAHAQLPDTRSEMAIPMTVGDRLLGVFNVQANTANRFSREDARIYNTLASQVAVALQNAELYAEQAATVERLRELDHLKSAFLANMSHELRTPLNSILGFAEVLLLGLDGPLNDTMNNDVRLIEKNGKHLLSLINDVLDMAKIEAGKMNLAFEKFQLRELLEETIDITSSLVREKGLYLHIEADSEDKFGLVADRVRLRQVMINIVSNAVKFTEKGGITIRAVQMPEERKLLIYVKDTGIGVPQDKLELIFESFSQVDTSTTRKAGGTGLGLPISRRLVEMHGGHLWAESTGVHGDGTTLIVELPFEAVKKS